MIFIYMFINLCLSVFIELIPELRSHEYIAEQYIHESINSINNIYLYWENTNGLNYSDYLVEKYNIKSGEIFNGLCGNVDISFIFNNSHSLTNLTYYQKCNISEEIFWNYNLHSLCNVSNKVCEYKNVNDIFNIHKRFFKIIDINPDLFLYEEIAYIQSEMWVLIIIFILVCLFGINSYKTHEAGNIKT